VRLIDELLRASERAEILRAMYEGDLGLTLYHAADAGGLLDTRFLLAAGADAGAEYGDALYNACIGGHLQVAEALLDAGGTLTQEHRNEALHYAARSGRTACCELLLDRGADMHHGGGFGDTLCFAAYYGHLETVVFLLDRGADAWSEQAVRYATMRITTRLSRCCWLGAKAGPPSDHVIVCNPVPLSLALSRI